MNKFVALHHFLPLCHLMFQRLFSIIHAGVFFHIHLLRFLHETDCIWRLSVSKMKRGVEQNVFRMRKLWSSPPPHTKEEAWDICIFLNGSIIGLKINQENERSHCPISAVVKPTHSTARVRSRCLSYMSKKSWTSSHCSLAVKIFQVVCTLVSKVMTVACPRCD